MMFLENIHLISILFLLYLGSYLAEVIAGIELNVSFLQQKFDLKKMLNSFIRAIATGVVLLLLTIIISFLPDVLEKANISIMNGMEEVISLLTIVTLLISAIIKYFTDTINKLRTIFNLSEEEEVELIETNNPIRIEREG